MTNKYRYLLLNFVRLLFAMFESRSKSKYKSEILDRLKICRVGSWIPDADTINAEKSIKKNIMFVKNVNIIDTFIIDIYRKLIGVDCILRMREVLYKVSYAII